MIVLETLVDEIDDSCREVSFTLHSVTQSYEVSMVAAIRSESVVNTRSWRYEVRMSIWGAKVGTVATITEANEKRVLSRVSVTSSETDTVRALKVSRLVTSEAFSTKLEEVEPESWLKGQVTE